MTRHHSVFSADDSGSTSLVMPPTHGSPTPSSSAAGEASTSSVLTPVQPVAPASVPVANPASLAEVTPLQTVSPTTMVTPDQQKTYMHVS